LEFGDGHGDGAAYGLAFAAGDGAEFEGVAGDGEGLGVFGVELIGEGAVEAVVDGEVVDFGGELDEEVAISVFAGGEDGVVHGGGVVDVGGVEALEVVGHAGVEGVPVFAAGGGPGGFGDGEASGPNHVLGVAKSGDGFGPEVALDAEDEGGVDAGGYGIEGVAGVESAEAVGGRFDDGVALEEVEVVVGAGGHDDVVVHLCGFDAAGEASPGHDGGVGGEATFEDFVPADEAFAVAVDDFFAAFDEVALEFVFVLEFFFFFESLTAWALGPEAFVGFVAAHVDVLAWEELGDFAEDVVEQVVDFGLGDAEGVLDFAVEGRTGVDVEGAFGAGEFGIGGEGSEAVAWDVDFGHDGDEAVLGVGDELADVVVGVEAAIGGFFVGLGRVEFPPVADAGDAPGTDFWVGI